MPPTLAHLVDAGRKLTASVIWDRRYERGRALHTDLTNLTPGLALAGPVFPVVSRGSILPVLQALEVIPALHILLVVDQAPRGAILGDIIMSAAKQQGVGGIVCLGCVRDVQEAATMGMPLWASAVTPAAATLGEACRELPGQVMVDGAPITKGDWLFGDRDGLVTIRGEHVRVVIKAAQIKDKKERVYRARLARGERLDEMMNLRAFVENRGAIKVEF